MMAAYHHLIWAQMLGPRYNFFTQCKSIFQVMTDSLPIFNIKSIFEKKKLDILENIYQNLFMGKIFNRSFSKEKNSKKTLLLKWL